MRLKELILAKPKLAKHYDQCCVWHMNAECWFLKKNKKKRKSQELIALANNLKLWGNQNTSETRRNFHFSTVYFPLALRFTTMGKSIVEPSLSRVLGSYLVFRVNPHPLRRKLSSYSNWHWSEHPGWKVILLNHWAGILIPGTKR